MSSVKITKKIQDYLFQASPLKAHLAAHLAIILIIIATQNNMGDGSKPSCRTRCKSRWAAVFLPSDISTNER